MAAEILKTHTPGPCAKSHAVELDSKNSLIAKNTLLTQACRHPLIFHFTCTNLRFSIFVGWGSVI